jgi:outer membrane protein assembly factor BamB
MTTLSFAQKKDISVISLNECWKYQPPNILALQPAVDSSNLYIAEAGGRVSAVSLASGTRLWSTELGGEIRSNLAVQGSNVFVASSDATKRMRLRGLSLTSGIPTLDIEIPFSPNVRVESVGSKLLIAQDSGYLASFITGGLKPEWQTTIPGLNISNMVFLNDKTAVAASDKTIFVVSITDGKVVISSPVENTISALNVFEGNIVVGDSRGNLTRYYDDYHTVYWRFRNGARISSIVSTDRGVLAASLDNFVYMTAGYFGDLRWKRRMAGRVSSIVVSGDIAVALTVGEPSAVMLDLDTGKPVGQLSIASDDSFTQPAIAADGKLLFFTVGKVLAESVQPCSLK